MNTHAALLVIIMAAATMLLRFLPFLVFLPALALAGAAVTLIRGMEPAAGDWVFIPCAAAVAAAGLLLRKTRAALRCEKVS